MVDGNTDRAHRIPDALWQQIEPLLPPQPFSKAGRPRMDSRRAMEAILYVLHTDCGWKRIPRDMGAPSTVYDRFQEWRRAGVFQRMWRVGILTYEELRELFWHGKRRVARHRNIPTRGKSLS